MSKKLQAIILALGLSVMIFGVGCSSDDDDTPSGPTALERLTGVWFAAPAGAVGDSVRTTLNGSETFTIIEYVNIAGPFDDLIVTKYDGTFEAHDDEIHFHVTTQDDTVAVDLSWDWAYVLSNEDEALALTHDYGTGSPVTVNYVYVAPPIY